MANKKTTGAGAALGNLIRARVLVVCAHGNPDDLVELDAEAARLAKENGHIDDHPSAVEYAERLRQARGA